MKCTKCEQKDAAEKLYVCLECYKTNNGDDPSPYCPTCGLIMPEESVSGKQCWKCRSIARDDSPVREKKDEDIWMVKAQQYPKHPENHEDEENLDISYHKGRSKADAWVSKLRSDNLWFATKYGYKIHRTRIYLEKLDVHE